VRHPGEIELALFAGGDLGFRERWRVRNHLRTCEDCRSELEVLRYGSQRLRDLSEELPEGVNWTRLSQEMTGNIRVGFAAGECVGPIPSHHPKSLGWHALAVMAAAFVIVLGAMWLNMPRDEAGHLMTALHSIGWHRPGMLAQPAGFPGSVVLEASQASIDLRANGGTMSLLTSRSEGVAVSVSMQGTAGAQYVDADTGQVTINQVHYVQ
jgi:hypothetical protein